MELQILGNGSGGLYVKRYFSSQIVKHAQHLFMIDCGEGTQMQIAKYRVRFERINHIFISHMHGDHVLGLAGFVSSYGMLQRKRPLHIYGPKGLRKFLETQITLCHMHLRYPVEIHEISTKRSQVVFDCKEITVTSLPLRHRIPTIGYRFETKDAQKINIRKEAISDFHLTIPQIKAIKLGQTITDASGEAIDPTLLILPPKENKSYAYCSDTTYSKQVVKAIKGVDLLYHEATFLESQRDRADLTGHSTASQAARVAYEAKVGKLLLGHLSARYDDFSAHEEEARKIFPNTFGSIEGVIYQI